MIPDLKRRALHRSKILEGQLQGLTKMINDENYCMDIIVQSLAIQKSLSSLSKLVLENHLRTHASHMLASADTDQQDKALAELLQLYELTNVRSK